MGDFQNVFRSAREDGFRVSSAWMADALLHPETDDSRNQPEKSFSSSVCIYEEWYDESAAEESELDAPGDTSPRYVEYLTKLA